MESATVENYAYFQYNKPMGLPVYVRYRQMEFDPDIGGFLRSMKFEQLSEAEAAEVDKKMTSDESVRVLTLSEASMVVAKQIASVRDSDRFGNESVLQKKGYSVYRFKNIGMIVYSFASNEWHMGCFPDFGNIDREVEYRVVMNRYLSWALVSFGIVGFWGTPVDEGVVIQRYSESRGEAVYFDIHNRKFISVDGNKKMKYNFTFIKLDNALKNMSITMKYENLLGFLSAHSTFFTNRGLSIPVRQLIQSLSRMAEGKVYPKENFRPRQEAHLEKA